MSNLLQVSALQSRLDEGKCPVPPEGGRPDRAEAQLEAMQGALRQREAEVRGDYTGHSLAVCLPGPPCCVQDVHVARFVGLSQLYSLCSLTLVWIVG